MAKSDFHKLEQRIKELEVKIRELTLLGRSADEVSTDGCTHGCTGGACPPTGDCTYGCTDGCTQGCTSGCGMPRSKTSYAQPPSTVTSPEKVSGS